MGPFGTGRELKNSFRFSPTPLPKALGVNGAPGRSTTLTGRSVKNCFRLDQNLSETRCGGAPNRGTALAGTATLSCAFVADKFRLALLGGRRVIIESGTFVPYIQPPEAAWVFRRRNPRRGVPTEIRFPERRIGCIYPFWLTPATKHCNIRHYAAFRCFPPNTVGK